MHRPWVYKCWYFGFAVLTSAILAPAQTPDALNPGANSTIYSLALQADGGIIVGGAFTSLGGQTRYGIGRLGADGKLDATFSPGDSGCWIYGAAVQPDGRILVAGSFATLAGQPHRNLGRLNADGTVDGTFATTISNSVNCLALQPDGKILVGGSFKGIDGQIRMYVARLSANGLLDSDFDPGADNSLNTLAVQPDGAILAGGRFTSMGSGGGAYLARLDSTGAADTSFYPSPNDQVYSLALQPDGRILTAGRFTDMGGQPCKYLGRLESDGTLDTTFNPAPGGIVYTLVSQADGKIIVGGSFTNLVGQPRNRIGRLNADGSLDQAFNPGASSTVYALALQTDGKVLAGGSFATLGGLARTNLGRMNNPDSPTESLVFSNATITWLRGGSSPEVHLTSFALSTNGSDWTTLGPGVRIPGGWQLDGLLFPPRATVRARGTVTGGQFNASSFQVESIAGFPQLTSQPASRTNNANTTALFSAGVIGSPASYRWRKGAVALSDSGDVSGSGTATLVLSNVFGGDAGNYSVVAINGSGSITSAVATLTVIDPLITNQPTNRLVNASQAVTLKVGAVGTALQFQWRKDGANLLAATDSALTLPNVQWADRGGYDVIVSNTFGSVTSIVAELTVNLAYPDALDINPSTSVITLVEQADGRILMGGANATQPAQWPSSLGRFNSVGGVDTTFNPTIAGSVWAVARQADSSILIAGNFNQIEGYSRTLFARLNADGTLDRAFDYSAIGWVFCLLVQPDGRTLMGGQILRLGELTNSFNCIARLNANGTPDVSFTPFVYGYLRSMALQADGKIVVAGFISQLGSLAATNLGRLNPDGSVDTNFTATADSEAWAVAIQPDGKILVGGTFTTLCGEGRSRIGRLNPDGTLDPTFNPILECDGLKTSFPNCYVSSIALQADGKILVGGLFTNLCGQLRNCLGRLNSDGTLDPTFNPPAEGLDASVDSLSLQADGKVLAAGQFSKLAGKTGNGFVRLNNPEPATQSLGLNGATLSWLRGGSSPEVYGTTFDYSTNGTTWTGLGTGSRVPGGWQLTGVSVPANASLRARGFITGGAKNGSSWFVETALGKSAITSQPSSRTNNAGTLAAFHVLASGAEPLSYRWYKDGFLLSDGGGISGALTPSLAISNVFQINAGNYSVVVSNTSGLVTSLVAKLTVVDPVITGQPVSQTLNQGANVTLSVTAAGTDLRYQWRKDGANVAAATSSSLSLTNLQGAHAGLYDVVVSNSFGVTSSAKVMLTVNTIFPDSFGPGANAQVYSLALQADGKVLVGGEFSVLANSARNYLGRLTPSGALDNFAPNISGFNTMQLALQADNHILVGGYFFTINGQTQTRLGRLNFDGSLDTTFIHAANDWLYGFTILPDGKFLVASTPEQLRRFNLDGTLDGSFNAALTGPAVAAAMLPDGRFIVGPALQSFKAVVRLNADGSVDPAFNASLEGVNTTISAMALQPDGKILVGGYFTAIAGQPRTNLARLNPDGTADLSFRVDPDSYVSSLALQSDGMILVGGAFAALAGQYRTNLARLNPDGTLDPTFNPGANDNVNAMALQPDGKILVGGRFVRLGGSVRNYVGRLNNNLVATQEVTFDGADITWMRGGSSPELGFAAFALSTNGVNWSDLGLGARVPGGWRFRNVSATTNSLIRARGFVTGAPWFIEQTNAVGPATPPAILSGTGFSSNRYHLNLKALPGQVVVIEASTDFANWVPLQTNFITGAGGFLFEDASSGAYPRRFYRARLHTGALPPPVIRGGEGGGVFQANQFGFSLLGVAGTTVVIETSTNLLNWTGLATNALGVGSVSFTDSTSTNYSRRFYRARFQ